MDEPVKPKRTRTRREVCGPGVCVFRDSPRGTHQNCIKCGVRFPCVSRTCGHIDCHEERGDPLPPGVSYAVD